MTDVFSKAKRSEVMSAIRSKGNRSTELALMRIFRSNGITGWRRNSCLVGRPDFVFPRTRLAVFVDGCYWHGHDCRKRRRGNNYQYWKLKISRNRNRDREVSNALRAAGWTVIRVWECEIEQHRFQRKLNRIRASLPSESPHLH